MSVTLSDSPDQTARVLQSLACEDRTIVDRSAWVNLQTWLATHENPVAIPFGSSLARLIPPVAVRLRRDFEAILRLIRAHAVLHQASRERDPGGRIVATLEDYRIVRELVADIVAEGVGSVVSETVREVVEAVRGIVSSGAPQACDGIVHASIAAVAKWIGIDRSAASRRVKAAINKGFLRNLERSRGAEARLVLGDPLPTEVELLPTVAVLREACACAGETEGIPPAREDEWGEVRFEA